MKSLFDCIRSGTHHGAQILDIPGRVWRMSAVDPRVLGKWLAEFVPRCEHRTATEAHVFYDGSLDVYRVAFHGFADDEKMSAEDERAVAT